MVAFDLRGYNERISSSGFRKWLHLARFKWLSQKFKQYKPKLDCIIELGCFDGRVLDYIPTPKNYHGYDANWEGGLQLASKRLSSSCHFHFCNDPSEFANIHHQATAFISLETLEHIEDNFLDGYIKKVSEILNGYIFITVPNEKGPLFAIKFFAKLIIRDAEKYSFREFIAATLGKMEYVQRNQHKGFDWQALLKHLTRYFDLVEVSGVQFPWFPLWANFQIGMVFRTR